MAESTVTRKGGLLYGFVGLVIGFILGYAIGLFFV